MDTRSKNLGGEPSWVRSNLEVFSHGYAMTAHDWTQLVQSPAGVYVFADLLSDPDRMDAVQSLLRACRKVLTLTTPVESENRDEIDKLKLEVIEALCKVESMFPKTELAVMFHILMHVPDCMYRWNSARNFWCFFGERYTAYLLLRQHILKCAVL